MPEKIIEFVFARPMTAIGIAAVVDIAIVCLFVWGCVL
jgi:hypothetical protein